jgi:DNA-binding NtrC family response regulator
MEHRLLLIDGPRTADSNSATLLVSVADFTWERMNIAALSFESLVHSNAHAIVAVAIPGSDRVIDLLLWLQSHPIPTPVIAVMPAGANDLMALASRATDDFILTPLQPVEFVNRVRRVIGWKAQPDENLVRKLTKLAGIDQLVGEDPAFVGVIEAIPNIARSDAPTLITGETGTGKDLCAHAIHHLSRRSSYPFIAVDCSTLPDHLFENELFGHARGAYTDAQLDQKGLVAMAENGTLFLDEIDALSPGTQAKLLRFLQEHQYKPLGSERILKADVNIIAATNRDLAQCVCDRQFRADLFYRLNVMSLRLPSLRERPRDIALLANHFVRTFKAGRPDAAPKTLSRSAVGRLMCHDWPGNVRELANVIQRAVWISEGSQILARDIDLPVTVADAASRFRDARAHALARFERNYVEQLLLKHAGNVTHAAEEAGKERRAFGRLVKKYRLHRSTAEN